MASRAPGRLSGYVDEFAVTIRDQVSRRPVLCGVIVFAGALALHGLIWLIASQVLLMQVASVLAAAAQHGWTVTTGDRTVGGWPLSATLSVDRPAISGGERIMPGGLAWSADRLLARISLRHPLTLVLSAQGQQFLRLSHAPDLGFVATRAEARISVSAPAGQWATFQADGVAGGIAGSRNPQDVQIATLRLTMHQQHVSAGFDGQKVTSVVVDARAHDVGLPDVGRWPLGATITDAGAELALVGLPTGADGVSALPGRTRAAAQAVAWRDGGGRVRINEARLRWGPLLLDWSAVLGLDGELQPVGDGHVQAEGTDAALDAASSGGLITPGVGLTAKAMLAVMPHDGRGAVRLPFTLRDRTLSVGHIPLARLGTITW